MNPNNTTKWAAFRISVLVSGLVFCLLLTTSSLLPATWDEGYMDARSDAFLNWIPHIPDKPIDDFCPAIEGHPYFPVILASVKSVAPSFLSKKTRLRFGAILFFSFAVGVGFYRQRKEFGTLSALFGITTILLIPRLYTHAQIAAWDSPLIAAWLLCWALFPAALYNVAGAALLGLAVGLAFSSKFSGLAVVLPIFSWLTLRVFCDHKYFCGKRGALLRNAAVTALVAFLVFVVVNPNLWANPWDGIARFFQLNMNREINVATQYFGQMYDLHHPLPWSNTFVWTVITVPTGILLLFCVGLAAMLHDNFLRWHGLFLLLNCVTLLAVRAMPGTPVHDGVRLFVPAYAFLALIAGLGAAKLWQNADRLRCPSRILVVGIYASCLVNMFWYAPQWLSYYNVFIGGLPGAAGAGMEPTYYWDGFDQEVIDWLNTHTEIGEHVAFSDWTESSFLLRKDGRPGEPHFAFRRSRCPLHDSDAGQNFRYYVLQRRPSAEYESDQWLIEHETPVFTKTIRRGGFGPWNLASVPIIAIYDLTKIPPPPNDNASE